MVMAGAAREAILQLRSAERARRPAWPAQGRNVRTGEKLEIIKLRGRCIRREKRTSIAAARYGWRMCIGRIVKQYRQRIMLVLVKPALLGRGRRARILRMKSKHRRNHRDRVAL